MMLKTIAKLCMAHASTHGARKPPGPIFTHGRFPEVGQKQKTEKEKKKKD